MSLLLPKELRIDRVIERLAEAEKGSWELNYSIMLTLGMEDDKDRCILTEYLNVVEGRRDAWEGIELGPTDFNHHYKDYTGSIDAAVTLIPQGLFWYLQCPSSYQITKDAKPSATTYLAGKYGFVDSGPKWHGVAETVPLATCVAALWAIRDNR